MARPEPARRSAFRPSLETLGERLAPAVFTVISTADSGFGTLREAINRANASPGMDTINFNLPLVNGVATITPRSALPTIGDRVVIDGRSQPGYAGQSVVGRPIVELNGSMAGPGADGLRLSILAGGTNVTPGSTIQGLVINQFSGDGIELQYSYYNTIKGCYIGTDVTGTLDRGNGYGVHVNGGGSNQIGGPERTVISGNDHVGVMLTGGTSYNQIRGNFIGMDWQAMNPVGNGTGVLIESSNSNTVGGGNVISGNSIGVSVRSSTGTRIVGNRIGLNMWTQAAAPNYHGVLINNASNTSITDNTISWNRGCGVVLAGTGTTGTTLLRNRIGTSPADSYGGFLMGRANARDGVLITDGASGNTIGSSSAADENVIAFNGGAGVRGAAGNTVTAFNRIFSNAQGQII